jgi:hypothetical protein
MGIGWKDPPDVKALGKGRHPFMLTQLLLKHFPFHLHAPGKLREQTLLLRQSDDPIVHGTFQ